MQGICLSLIMTELAGISARGAAVCSRLHAGREAIV